MSSSGPSVGIAGYENLIQYYTSLRGAKEGQAFLLSPANHSVRTTDGLIIIDPHYIRFLMNRRTIEDTQKFYKENPKIFVGTIDELIKVFKRNQISYDSTVIFIKFEEQHPNLEGREYVDVDRLVRIIYGDRAFAKKLYSADNSTILYRHFMLPTESLKWSEVRVSSDQADFQGF